MQLLRVYTSAWSAHGCCSLACSRSLGCGATQAAVHKLHEDGIEDWHSGMTQAEAACQARQRRAKTAAPAGAHHAWVRQWREETGGSLAEGRQAWKALDTQTMWQFKIDYAAKETAVRKMAANGAGKKGKENAQGRRTTSTNNKKAAKGADSDEKTTHQKTAKVKPSTKNSKAALTVSLSKHAAKAKPKSMKRS